MYKKVRDWNETNCYGDTFRTLTIETINPLEQFYVDDLFLSFAVKRKEGLEPMKGGITALRENSVPGNWRLPAQGQYNISSLPVQNTTDLRFSKPLRCIPCIIEVLDQVLYSLYFSLN